MNISKTQDTYICHKKNIERKYIITFWFLKDQQFSQKKNNEYLCTNRLENETNIQTMEFF